ncbi:hypothetical protein FHETE_9818 [Fusarium heterosporum]|uniref:F-box domain-containing protein n=1 Tax=Fusarium heterosporum TaxID=42747 RepID=A0A8H5SWX4_FUSHE|nr:hypothetical protein FHETE_9818 [Fusarium heterosporum]
MASLNSLPIELILDIAKRLPSGDAKSLSCASKLIREKVARLLFTTLSITCPLESGKGLDEHVGKYGNLISRVNLHLSLQPNFNNKTQEGDPIPSIWGTPPLETVKKIVMGKILPHVGTLSVKFDPLQFDPVGPWDGDIWWGDSSDLGGIYICLDPEDDDKIMHQEQTIIWRAQYTEFFKCIAPNQNITKFTISNLLPRDSSAWETPEWKEFLGRLKDVNISMFGADNGAGWHANTVDGFGEFVHSLPDKFMKFAENVEHLSLEANPEGLLGSHPENWSVQLPLSMENLPKLFSLSLKNVMVGDELLEFLKSHNDTLHDFEVHDCMCDEDNVTWAKLWETMREENAALLRVHIEQSKTPPLEYTFGQDGYRTPEEVENVRKKLAEDKSLVVWRYVIVDDKYGNPMDVEDVNLRRVKEGDDQTEYRRLLELLEERNKSMLSEH